MKIIFNPFTGRLDFIGAADATPDWTLGYPTYDARYLQLSGGTMTGNINFNTTDIGIKSTGLGYDTEFIPFTSQGRGNYTKAYSGTAITETWQDPGSIKLRAENASIYSTTVTINPGSFSAITIDGGNTYYGLTTDASYSKLQWYDFFNNYYSEIKLDSNGTGIKGNTFGTDVFAYLNTNNLIANRTYQFPDANGTILLDTTYSTILDGTYAKLDGSNQPFTSEIFVLNASSKMSLKASGTYPTTYANSMRFGFIDSTGTYRTTISSYYQTGKYILDIYNPAGRIWWVSDVQEFFNNAGTGVQTTYTANTGNWNFTGFAKNLLTIANGIKIGNNTDTAATAGAGSIKSVGTGLGYSNGSFWQNLSFVNSTAERTYTFPDASGTVLLDTISDSIYARLDGANFPFTSNIVTTGDEISTTGTWLRLISTSDITMYLDSNHRIDVNASQSSMASGSTLLRVQNDNGALFKANTIAFQNISLGVSGYINPIVTDGNFITTTYGIKIGDNVNTAATAGSGSLKHNNGTYESDGTTWNKFLTDKDTTSHVYAESLSSANWVLDAGDIYYQDITHNLATEDIGIEIYDSTTKETVIAHKLDRTSTNVLRVYVQGNTDNLRVVIWDAIFGLQNTQRKVVKNPTSPYTPKNGDIVIWDATAGNKTLALPTVSNSLDFVVDVKKIDASVNTITVDPSGAELIEDGANAILTTQYESISIACDGTAWWLVAAI